MRPSLRPLFRIALFGGAALSVIPAARALTLYGGATSTYTSDPGDGMPWSNVGDNGIYLGAYDTGYWIITANHVGAIGLTLNGSTYSAVSGSAQRIGTTDILLYRLDVSGGAPALSNLTITSSTPVSGQPVRMVADGSGTMTWGTNNVAGYAFYDLGNSSEQTYGLFTNYDLTTASEAQAQNGDSGGALFYYDTASSKWWLSGIISGIGSSSGTDFTVSASVAYYYSSIMAIVSPVPEPAAWAALLGMATLMGTVVVRKRSRP